jgi:hypothetical protein
MQKIQHRAGPWIACSDQMPEPLESVLLAIPTWRGADADISVPAEEFHFEVGWYVPCDPIDTDGESMFNTEADDYEIASVTHWQPIVGPTHAGGDAHDELLTALHMIAGHGDKHMAAIAKDAIRKAESE